MGLYIGQLPQNKDYHAVNQNEIRSISDHDKFYSSPWNPISSGETLRSYST
jgi:hypothetical protein